MAEEGKMDNYTLTMLSTLVFLVIFVLVVNRLTHEDHKRMDKAK
jgi:hypothetical protein